MKVQSVRFGEYQWKSIALAADADGISAAQFIRDSAFARAVLVLYVSGAPGSERIKFANLLGQTLKDHPKLVAQMHKAFAEAPDSDAPRPDPPASRSATRERSSGRRQRQDRRA